MLGGCVPIAVAVDTDSLGTSQHVELPQGQAAYWKADDRFDQSHSWTYTLLINDRQRRFTEGENDFALL